MKVTINNLPKSQIEMTVEIPADKWKTYYDRAAKHLAEHVNIPGFRPGKMNAKMLEQNVGSAAIYEELANIAVNDTFHHAAEENKLFPIGSPKVELVKLAPENPIVYKATFSVLPKIELDDYKKYLAEAGIKRSEPKVEEKEINESVEYLLNSRSKLVTVDRPAKKGDRIELDFTTRLGNVKLDKGESKNHPMIIGKSHFLPEFEAQVTGMKANEEKEFEIKYPENYFAKEIAGKNVKFNVKMNLVQEIEKPELNDEFAKTLGNFTNAGSLRKSISEGILEEKKQKEKEKFRTQIIEKLIGKFGSKDLPEVLIEAEKDRIFAEFKYNIESNGMRLEDYLNQIKKTEADLKKEWEEPAKNRINTFLINYEIARTEEIKISEDEMKTEINKILAHYKSASQAEKDIDIEKLTHNVHDFLINNKVFELLEKIATGEKIEKKAEEKEEKKSEKSASDEKSAK